MTYKIVKRDFERAHFTINQETGVLNTTQIFDRDEPARQKELYVTVQATDNGRPPLADICTIKVVVTDINDNTPSFDSVVSLSIGLIILKFSIYCGFFRITTRRFLKI